MTAGSLFWDSPQSQRLNNILNDGRKMISPQASREIARKESQISRVENAEFAGYSPIWHEQPPKLAVSNSSAMPEYHQLAQREGEWYDEEGGFLAPWGELNPEDAPLYPKVYTVAIDDGHEAFDDEIRLRGAGDFKTFCVEGPHRVLNGTGESPSPSHPHSQHMGHRIPAGHRLPEETASRKEIRKSARNHLDSSVGKLSRGFTGGFPGDTPGDFPGDSPGDFPEDSSGELLTVVRSPETQQVVIDPLSFPQLSAYGFTEEGMPILPSPVADPNNPSVTSPETWAPFFERTSFNAHPSTLSKVQHPQEENFLSSPTVVASRRRRQYSEAHQFLLKAPQASPSTTPTAATSTTPTAAVSTVSPPSLTTAVYIPRVELRIPRKPHDDTGDITGIHPADESIAAGVVEPHGPMAAPSVSSESSLSSLPSSGRPSFFARSPRVGGINLHTNMTTSRDRGDRIDGSTSPRQADAESRTIPFAVVDNEQLLYGPRQSMSGAPIGLLLPSLNFPLVSSGRSAPSAFMVSSTKSENRVLRDRKYKALPSDIDDGTELCTAEHRHPQRAVPPSTDTHSDTGDPEDEPNLLKQPRHRASSPLELELHQYNLTNSDHQTADSSDPQVSPILPSPLSPPSGTTRPLRIISSALSISMYLVIAFVFLRIVHLTIHKFPLLDRHSLLLLSVLAPATSIAVGVSPIPVVVKALRDGKADILPVPLFYSTALTNVFSVDYGRKTHNLPLVVTNIFGLVMQLFFLSCNHYMTDTGSRRWRKFFVQVVSSVLFVWYVCTLMSTEVVGMAVIILNVVLFSTPLRDIKTVVVSGSADRMPWPIIAMMILQNGVWTLYGALLDSPVIYIPSVICFEIVVFQIIVIIATVTKSAFPLDISCLRALCDASPDCTPSASPPSPVSPSSLELSAEHSKSKRLKKKTERPSPDPPAVVLFAKTGASALRVKPKAGNHEPV